MKKCILFFFFVFFGAKGFSQKSNLQVINDFLDSTDKSVERYNQDNEIINKVNISTALGNLDCYVIQGLCKTKLTDTKTVFYFNETYGFVKIVYDLFDKSRLELNLKEVKHGIESTLKW
jgi:hypothetical protein